MFDQINNPAKYRPYHVYPLKCCSGTSGLASYSSFTFHPECFISSLFLQLMASPTPRLKRFLLFGSMFGYDKLLSLAFSNVSSLTQAVIWLLECNVNKG